MREPLDMGSIDADRLRITKEVATDQSKPKARPVRDEGDAEGTKKRHTRLGEMKKSSLYPPSKKLSKHHRKRPRHPKRRRQQRKSEPNKGMRNRRRRKSPPPSHRPQ